MSNSLNQRERAIREKRMIEATRKNIMGPSGKLGMIARYLGTEIISQGNFFSDSRSIDEYTGETYDVYNDTTPGEIPFFDPDESFIELQGYLFDGLSRGLHLEIKYLKESHKITVHYKGYPVYMEKAGELFAYAPFDDWEKLIDKLYEIARKRHESELHNQKNKDIEAAEGIKADFLQRLRTRWGI